MFNDLFHRMKVAFHKKASINDVMAYIPVIPNKILVSVVKDNDYYIAVIKSIDDEKVNFATQGRDLREVIEMISDAVYTYLDIPYAVSSQLPKFFPEDITEEQFLALSKDRIVNFARV